ncbi:hypothetical protein TDB9533_00816 [Thalassocella blandensis]|nr:hypothetical protein TDB9533_00816 [Thalassocella blandensis]
MEEMVTGIVASVDFTPIVVGIGGIAAAVALVYIAMSGGGMLLSMLRRR